MPVNRLNEQTNAVGAARDGGEGKPPGAVTCSTSGERFARRVLSAAREDLALMRAQA